MSETNHSHHHHHHHHHHHQHVDEATKWKRRSLMAIERRKVIKKWLWRFMVCLAIIMGVLVLIVYNM